MFEDVFNTFYENNKGIIAIGVWGKDGLELEKSYFSDAKEVDLEFSGAELADIISKLDKTKVSPSNYVIKMNFYNYHLRIFSLTSEYFLMILSEPDVFDGKLNFYLNIYQEQMISAL